MTFEKFRARLTRARREAPATAPDPPAISVLTPTWNTRLAWLADATASLWAQLLTSWEWCVADDGSDDSELRRALAWLAVADPRIRVTEGSHGGISRASNAALGLARAEFVCLVDHDDTLAPSALEETRAALAAGADVVYSDEDKLDVGGRRYRDPFFKPDWSPEYFRGVMYVGHLLGARRRLVEAIGGFHPAFDGVQDYELMLRLSERTGRIHHIPKILYHWRAVPGSVAASLDGKPEIEARQQAAVDAHLVRMGLRATAAGGIGRHRVRIVPAPRERHPLISVIVPTRDAPHLLGPCLESLFGRSTYPNFEVVLVDNDTTDREALALMARFPVHRVPLAGAFNFSRANNVGSRAARGEYLVFLNNDTTVVSPGWLEELLYHAEQDDVGLVGALLLYPNGTVQHAGVILGPRGTADHVMRGFPGAADGYAGSLVCAREVSAVTAACAMVKRRDFDGVGGFDEHYFTHYQDVDLCLRMRRAGKRNIYTPRAVLYHHESASRREYYDRVDRTLLLDRWADDIDRGDPYYNPSFDPQRSDYAVRAHGVSGGAVVREIARRVAALARNPRRLPGALRRRGGAVWREGVPALRAMVTTGATPATRRRAVAPRPATPPATADAPASRGERAAPGGHRPLRSAVRNVLFVLYHDFTANSASHVHNFANGLATLGMECVVAVPWGRATVAGLGPARYRIVEFGDIGRIAQAFPDGYGPDVVHAWTPREIVRRWCDALRALHSFRLCIHLEDNEEHLLANFLGRSVADLADDRAAVIPDGLVHPLRYRAFLRSADGVTVIIDRLREFVPEGIPSLTLWPGVDPARFHPMAPDPAFRARIDRPPGTGVLCYTGNVHPANAHEVRSLYLAVAMLNREGSPTVMVRAGRDTAAFLGDTDSWVRPFVVALGHVEHVRIPALMSLADVYVQPGRADDFNDYRLPSKIPEFLAMGKPVVVPRTNLGRFLRDGVDAIVPPVVDATAIVDVVGRLRGDPALAARLGQGALDFAKAHLDWGRNSAALKRFYESLGAL